MDLYQPTSLFSSSQVELQESKVKKNPFAETNEVEDPICSLNLKETSEFVKALPIMSNNYSVQRIKRSEIFQNNNSNLKNFELQPPTPGRPIFNFSAARKSVPSKWDDAEKWLFNGGGNGGSCDASPAHNNNNNVFSNPCHNHIQSYIFGNYPRSSISKHRVSCDTIVQNVSRGVYNEEKKTVLPLFNNNCSSDGVGFNGAIIPSDLPLKDKFTDEVGLFEPNFKYSEPSKETFLFKSHKLHHDPMKDACTEIIPYQDVKHRDIGTEMTPLGSSTTSRCHTPFKSTSPARHNTPASRSGPLELSTQTTQIDMAKLQECDFAKLQIGSNSSPFDLVGTNWSSREEEEEDVSKSLRHFELGRRSLSVNESRACVWEEEEKTKSCIRYRREEAKIQAWINLQTAKAEAQSRKLEEITRWHTYRVRKTTILLRDSKLWDHARTTTTHKVKIQKMRANMEEKLMKRMAIVNRKAEEWREAAQIEHSEQIRKATEQAQKLVLNRQRNHGRNPHLSPHVVSCCCFPCTSDH